MAIFKEKNNKEGKPNFKDQSDAKSNYSRKHDGTYVFFALIKCLELKIDFNIVFSY